MSTSIGSIYGAKELAQTYSPVFLFEWSFPNSQFLHLSSSPLSSRYGGVPTAGAFTYGSIEWVPRIVGQNLGPTQAMADVGVDVPPQVQVTIADPDREIYSSWEIVFGFKGTILTIYIVMWDAANFATGSFSSDSPAPIIFRGTCSAATNMDDRTMTVVSTSLLNMTQQQMPPTRIQPLCSHNFPQTYANRLDGLNNSDSPFYGCAYSPDISGGCGNFESGTAAFTFCDLSSAACIERLGNASAAIPIIQDNNGNPTGRFSGLDYIPVEFVGLERSYVTGQWDLIINQQNQAKYGDYISLCYGTVWTQPEIVGTYGDGNYNCCEALLCNNQVSEIINVVCNGDLVPQLPNNPPDPWEIPTASTTNTPEDNWWRTINNGGRNGHTNPQIGWLNKGDPYGSLAAIYIHALVQLVANNSIPEVQVLLKAGYIRVYTAPTTYTYEYSSNPAWILLDLLVQATWRYSDIDLASFIAAAAVCDESIYFNSVTGTYQNYYNEAGSPPYARYSVGIALQQRQSIGQVIAGVRNAMRGQLYFNFTTGLLSLTSKRTLADQQPNPIPGSNYNAPVESVTNYYTPTSPPSDVGEIAFGYAAYSFDATNILKINGESTLKIRQKGYQETPNKSTVYFFDRENSYNQDISTIIDTEDSARVGSEVSGTFNLMGCQTFDHIDRVTASWFAENYRGNSRQDYTGSYIGDTGGTIIAELQTTIKGVHLTVGQIVLLSDVQNSLNLQTFRITRIEPSANFETAKISMSWHNDYWYLDSFGQGVNQPIWMNPLSGAQGAPRSWRPAYEVPQSGDAYRDPTDLGFGIAQTYGTDAGGNALAQVQFTGQIPVNSFQTVSQRPLLAPLGEGSSGGGYAPGTAYYVGLSAMAVDGTMSPLSSTVAVNLQSPDDALDAIVQGWPAGATGYFAFAGTSPSVMTFQQSNFGLTEVVSLVNSYQVGSWGPPDQSFSGLLAELCVEEHAGVLGGEVESVTSNSIQIAVYNGYGFGVNQFAGREVSVLGTQGDLSSPVYTPIANFTIASNTADTLTLVAGDPTTCNYGQPLSIGDAVTVRILPTFGQDSTGFYFEDASWVNCLNEVGTEYQVIGATSTSPVVLTLQNNGGAFPFTNGQFVVVQEVLGLMGANGGFVVGGVDSTAWTLELVGSTGVDSYTSGGWAAAQTQGLEPNAEVGNLAFFIKGAGKGTFAKIASNTGTRCYIVGQWPVAPDSSSRLVILSGSTSNSVLMSGINNSNPNTVESFKLDVLNYGRQTVFLQVSSRSPTGVASGYVNDEFRELFLFGAQAPTSIASTLTQTTFYMSIGMSMINADATLGSITFVLLPASQISGRTITVSKSDSTSNTVTIVPYSSADEFEDGTSSVVLSFIGDSQSMRVQ